MLCDGMLYKHHTGNPVRILLFHLLSENISHMPKMFLLLIFACCVKFTVEGAECGTEHSWKVCEFLYNLGVASKHSIKGIRGFVLGLWLFGVALSRARGKTKPSLVLSECFNKAGYKPCCSSN